MLPAIPNSQSESGALGLSRTFRFFKYDKAPLLSQYDPTTGPYGLECLSEAQSEEFEAWSKEYEEAYKNSFLIDVFMLPELESEKPGKHAELVESNIKLLNKAKRNLLTHWAEWFRSTGILLQNEKTWESIRYSPDKQEKMKAIRDRWLSCSEFAHYYSPSLIEALKVCRNFDNYFKKAKDALVLYKDRKFIPTLGWKLRLPFIQAQSTQLSINSPLDQEFSESFEKYLNHNIEVLNRIKERLANAMLLRLEVAAENKDLKNDDIFFWLKRKLTDFTKEDIKNDDFFPWLSQTFTDLTKKNDEKSPLNLKNISSIAQGLLSPTAFEIFHQHILMSGTIEAKEKLMKLPWFEHLPGTIRMTLRPWSKGVIVMPQQEAFNLLKFDIDAPRKSYIYSVPYTLYTVIPGTFFNGPCLNEGITYNLAIAAMRQVIKRKELDFSEVTPKNFEKSLIEIDIFLQKLSDDLNSHKRFILEDPFPPFHTAWQKVYNQLRKEITDYFCSIIKSLPPNVSDESSITPESLKVISTFANKNSVEANPTNHQLIKECKALAMPLAKKFLKMLDDYYHQEKSLPRFADGDLCHLMDYFVGCLVDNQPAERGLRAIRSIIKKEKITSSLEDLRALFQLSILHLTTEEQVQHIFNLMTILSNSIENPNSFNLSFLQEYDQIYKGQFIKSWISNNSDILEESLTNVEALLSTPKQPISNPVLLLTCSETILAYSKYHQTLAYRWCAVMEKYLNEYEGGNDHCLQVLLNYQNKNWLSQYAIRYLSYIVNHQQTAQLIKDRQVYCNFENIYKLCPEFEGFVANTLQIVITKYLQQVNESLLDCLKSSKKEEMIQIQSISTSDLIELINKYFSGQTKIHFQEAIDKIYYIELEFHVKLSSKAYIFQKFRDILNFNFPEFPLSQFYQHKILTLLNTEIFSQTWKFPGYTICAIFEEKSWIDLSLVQQYRFKWLQQFFKKDVNLGKYIDCYYPLEKLLSYEEISHMYGPFLDEAFKVIQLYLQEKPSDKPRHRRIANHFIQSITQTNRPETQAFRLSSQSLHKFDQKIEDFLRVFKRGLKNEISSCLNKWINDLSIDLYFINIAFPVISGFFRRIEEWLKTSLEREDLDVELVKDCLSFFDFDSPNQINRFSPLDETTRVQLKFYLQRIINLCEKATEIRKVHQSLSGWLQTNKNLQDWTLRFQEQDVDYILDMFGEDQKKQLAERLISPDIVPLDSLSKEGLLVFCKALNRQSIHYQSEREIVQRAIRYGHYKATYLSLNQEEREKFRAELDKKEKSSPQIIALIKNLKINESSTMSARNFAWETKLESLFDSSLQNDKSALKVWSTSLGTRFLRKEMRVQLFKEDGSINGTIEKGNKHFVIPIRVSNTAGKEEVVAYAKFFPDAPGLQRAATILRRMLFGEAPAHDLIRIQKSENNPKEDYIVLISENIPGTPLNKHEPWQTGKKMSLHQKYYTREVITLLLNKERDGKPANHNITPVTSSNSTPLYRLIPIENERVFGPEIEYVNGEIQISLLSALFCCDEMNDILDEETVTTFLNINPAKFLDDWILELGQYDQRHIQIFNPEACQYFFKKDQSNSIIPFPFKGELIMPLYITFSRIQDAMLSSRIEKKPMTHLQLVKCVFPLLGNFYEKLIRRHETPKARFHELATKAKTRYEVSQIREEFSYQSSAPSSEVFESLLRQIPNMETLANSSSIDVLEARNIILGVDHQVKQLKEVREELKKGNIVPFRNLSLNHHREKVINGIKKDHLYPPLKWGDLSAVTQKEVLLSIQEAQELRLIRCESLNDDLLIAILKKSPHLQILDLTGCKKISLTSICLIPYLCPTLRTLILQHLDIKNLTDLPNPSLTFPKDERINEMRKKLALPFPCLEFLSIKGSFQLENVSLYAPVLQFLNIKKCAALKTINIYVLHETGLWLAGKVFDTLECFKGFDCVKEKNSIYLLSLKGGLVLKTEEDRRREAEERIEIEKRMKEKNEAVNQWQFWQQQPENSDRRYVLYGSDQAKEARAREAREQANYGANLIKDVKNQRNRPIEPFNSSLSLEKLSELYQRNPEDLP